MANMNFGVNLLPKTDNTYSLGTDNDGNGNQKRWANIYATIFNGDLNGNADTATLASTITTTADTTNNLYPIGVTSGATTTLKRNTSITMTGDTITANYFIANTGSNPTFIKKINEYKADGGGWARYLIQAKGNNNEDLTHIGLLGNANSVTYMYIGMSSYDATTNLRVYPSGVVFIPHTQESSSTGTGALQVGGGVGIAKKLYVGGDASFAGNITLSDATKSISRAGSSINWNQASTRAMIRMISQAGWSPLLTLKANSGWWSMGHYNSNGFNDHLLFTFLNDNDVSGVSGAQNHMDYTARLIPVVHTDTAATDRAFVTAPWASSKAAVGSATQPIYIDNNGVATAGTALKALAYEDSLTYSDVGAAPAVTGGYLPKSGGQMAGTAHISWADSGSWGKSDATFPNKRGGLYWTGTSDWIDLFAEETASDNFNLVIDVGDDASPSLILRNKGTTTITLTPGSGTISATSFSGSGSSLTALNASNISSGTLSADRLATSGASAGSYGPSTAITGSNGTTMNVPYITVDDKGRVTSISNKVYTAVNTWRPIGTGASDAAAGNHDHDLIYSAIHQTTWSWASDGTKPLSKYVTFDANIAAGNTANAPDAGWYNGFVSSHGNYLGSFILNKHRTNNWYVGWEQYPKDSSTTYTEPTWYLLAHSGNVETGDNNGQIKIAGVNVGVKGLAALAYKGTLAWNEITQTGADNLPEGNSNWTDNTEILTSYASNNGFADTNAKGKVYRRDAIAAWNYINTKAASVYAKLASPALTGTPTAPTAANGTSTIQIATTEFVNNTLAYANAMTFKGTLGTGGTITALPASHNAGDTYRVITAGTWAGKYCEVGTLIICTTDGTAANDAHWTSVETNEDGAVIGPTSSTENSLAFFNSTSGRVLNNTGTYVKYLNHIAANAGTNSIGYIDGLLITGTAYGEAENLVSNTDGQMAYGDAGPQIRFNSNDQLGAIIFNHYDNSSGMGAAFHFVTNQGNGVAVKTDGLIARTRAMIGGNSVNTSYTLYSNGATYINGALTMNGIIHAKGSMYEDSYSGALNMNNSNIYGLNSIYTQDTSENASEGIHFYRDATHVDSLWMNGGNIYFVPNRALGTSTTAANSQKVLRGPTTITDGYVFAANSTTGLTKQIQATNSNTASTIVQRDANGNFSAGTITASLTGNATSATTAGSITNFQVSTTSSLGLEITTNSHGYVSGLTRADWNYQQTDGVIYGQFYNTNWKHEIFGDYRTGQISVRGKNNGTWQDWRRVLDENNYATILGASNPATYKMADSTFMYKYSQTYTTSSPPETDWYVKVIIAGRTWSSDILPLKITASYCNIAGQVYLDLDSYNNLFRAYRTTYSGCNIKAVSKTFESNKCTFYLQMAKPTEYPANSGTIPNGKLTIYSPIEITSIEEVQSMGGTAVTLQSGYNANTGVNALATKATGDKNGDDITTHYVKVYNTGNVGNSSTVTVNDLAASGNSVAMINAATDNPLGSAKWVHVISLNWSNSATTWISQIAVGTGNSKGLYYRTNASSSIVGKTWMTVLDSDNYSSYALPLTGGTLTGVLNLKSDLNLYTSTADSPDIVWWYADKSKEQARIWMGSGSTAKWAPNYRCYDSSGNSLYSGNLVLGDGTGASGSWNINITGNAATASQLKTNSGNTPHDYCLQYYSGQPTVGSADGNAYAGSSNNYKLWSYPDGATSASGGIANVQVLRFWWSTNYLHDIFVSPNYEEIYYRSIIGGTAKDWRKFLDSGNTAAGTNNNATLAWNTTYTIAKINGTDIKFKTMAKPTYTYSDVGAAAASHDHNRLNGIGRLSASADAIAFNTTTSVGNRMSWCIYDSTSRNKDATNSPSFDASTINMPWDWGAFVTQLALENAGTRLQIRGATHVDHGEGANPRYTPTYTAWREIVTADKATQMGSTTQPVYINNTGQVVACTAYSSASVNYATSAGSASKATAANLTTTANALAYYTDATGTFGNASKITVYNDVDITVQGATKKRNGIRLSGTCYGNTATDLTSNTAGVMRYEDGGVRIEFSADSSDNAALLYTNHDSANTGGGSSFHFVGQNGSNNTGGNLAVTAPDFVARRRMAIGSNFTNSSYALHVTGATAITNNTGASTSLKSSQLVIANRTDSTASSVAVGLELYRQGVASWQIVNDGGTLYFKNNYTTAVQTTYNKTSLTIAYNTGNATFAGSVTATGGFSGALTGNASSSTTTSYLKLVATNEIRFDVNTKPSSTIDVHIGHAWSDGTKDAKITGYHFKNGNGATTGVTIYAATFSGALSGNASTASKIAAKLASTTKHFLVGTSTTLTGTAANVELLGDGGIYATATSGELSAVRYSWNANGTEKAYTIYNTTDDSIDFVFI